jgi:hypothetical protein
MNDEVASILLEDRKRFIGPSFIVSEPQWDILHKVAAEYDIPVKDVTA